jgi:hypothetical protein
MRSLAFNLLLRSASKPTRYTAYFVYPALSFTAAPTRQLGEQKPSESSNQREHWRYQYGRKVSTPNSHSLTPCSQSPQGNWFPITRAAIATLPDNLPYPSQAELNSIHNSGWDDPWRIAEFLADAGFTDIDVTTGDKKIAMALDDLAEACLMVNPIILGRFWTQEQRDKYAHLVPGDCEEVH